MHRWRFLFTLLLTCGALNSLRAAEEKAGVAEEAPASRYSRPEVKKEIVSTIERQLAALRAKNFAEAYACAARAFRAQFTLPQFQALILRSYPVIALNRTAEFGLPMDNGVSAILTVTVVSTDGRSVAYRYAMLKEPEGWRVGGVIPEKVRAPDA